MIVIIGDISTITKHYIVISNNQNQKRTVHDLQQKIQQIKKYNNILTLLGISTKLSVLALVT